MKKRGIQINLKNRVSIIAFSRSWYTLTPWEHRGLPVKYFDIRKEVSEKVRFTYLYIGPIGIISGTRIN